MVHGPQFLAHRQPDSLCGHPRLFLGVGEALSHCSGVPQFLVVSCVRRDAGVVLRAFDVNIWQVLVLDTVE